ncbi:MAG: hypothetical protein ACSLE9_07770 [Burkholderiaceae bacterium]
MTARFVDELITDALRSIARARQSLERLPHESITVPVVEEDGTRTDKVYALHRYPCAVCDIEEALKLAEEAIETDDD